VDTMQPDRERFDQSRVGSRHFVRQCERVPGRHDGILGEAAPVRSHPDVASLRTVRYQACRAVLAAATRNNWQDSHIGAFPPAAGIRSDGDNLASELVAHDHASGHEGLRLDIGPAYTARGDTDHELVGTRCRIGYFDDVEAVLFGGDGRLHCSDPSSSMSKADATDR
jgi:hypothetical protein